MLRPPCILHLHSNEADDRVELVSLCSSALHFSKGETKLLQFYSNCKSGFRPAQSVVAKAISVDRRYVAKIRQRLVEKGVVLLQNNKLFLDWNRIRLFSTLDSSMTSKKDTIEPVSLTDDSILKKLESQYTKNGLISYDIDDLCGLFQSMSENDYIKFLHYVAKHTIKNDPIRKPFDEQQIYLSV